MTSKVYISGRISGRDSKEAEAHFGKARETLLREGNDVVSPFVSGHQYQQKKDYSWSDWMRESIVSMMECDTIFMLNGWEDSRGAMIEHYLALDLGFTIKYEVDHPLPGKPELLTE